MPASWRWSVRVIRRSGRGSATSCRPIPGWTATNWQHSCEFHASPTGFGTELAGERETRVIDGRPYVLEYPIHGDLALIKAERGDRWGNLTYRKAARNFGPVMAMAAKKTVASVHEIAELGTLDPEAIVTPGIFVSKIMKIARTATQAGGFKEAA